MTFRRLVGVVVATSLMVSLLDGSPVAADTVGEGIDIPDIEQPAEVDIREVPAIPRSQGPEEGWHPLAQPPSWPKTGKVDVDLSDVEVPSAPAPYAVTPDAVAGSSKPKTKEVKDRPMRIAPDTTQDRLDKASVEFLKRGEGATDVRFQVKRKDGKKAKAATHIELDYSKFADAFGGDWASRLQVVRIPACAAEAKHDKECVAEVMPSHNDTKNQTVSAQVMVGESATTYALAASAEGDSGSFKATPLSASGSWSAGGNSGDFTWSYPISVPPAPSSLAPDVSLDYSSASVDGRTSSTNNQASWVGEGFDYNPGAIERRYATCFDEGVTTSGDLCWKSENAILDLNGSVVELVRDDTTGVWRAANDDGMRIEKLTGAPNGDNDGEYWRITTTDGTQYYFGRNRHTGWTEGKPDAQSTWTVPVFGNNENEPCRTGSFQDGWCNQAWRWNLDYVVDVHGNAMTYFYAPEQNYYTRGTIAYTPYTRSGTLSRIEYGQRDGETYSTTAPMRVNFEAVNRTDSEGAWRDVPWDQNCNADTVCTVHQISPTFWHTKRLAAIQTEVYRDGGYRSVDRWELSHLFPSPGDGTSPALWLETISHVGKNTGSNIQTGDVRLPDVNFDGIQLANRVPGFDGPPPLVRYRINAIHSETGSDIGVTYEAPTCSRAALPDPASNTTRCFPSWWSYGGSNQPVLDWFQKYVVSSVVVTDRTGGSPPEHTYYEYLDAPAWTIDTDEFTVDSRRTSRRACE